MPGRGATAAPPPQGPRTRGRRSRRGRRKPAAQSRRSRRRPVLPSAPQRHGRRARPGRRRFRAPSTATCASTGAGMSAGRNGPASPPTISTGRRSSSGASRRSRRTSGSGGTAPASPGHGRPLPRARPGAHPRAGLAQGRRPSTGRASTTSPAARALSASAPRTCLRGRTGWRPTSVWSARAGRSSTTPAPTAFIWTAWRAARGSLRDTVSRMERFTPQHRTRSQRIDRGPSRSM